MFWCKHGYDEVKDGYQYCNKCGVAIAAPRFNCNHRWVQIAKYSKGPTWNDSITTIISVRECTNCGEIKQVEIL